MDKHAHESREMQLEFLLRELLGEEPGDQRATYQRRKAVPSEVAELQDLARRLRASIQWVPLPEGQEALRRALVTTAVLVQSGWTSKKPAYQRVGWRPLAAAAAALALGVFSIGTSMAWDIGSPSNGWIGARVAFEEMKVVLVPSQLGKAEMLVNETRARLADIKAMAASGDTHGLRRAADALDLEASWLHATMASLSAREQKQVASQLSAVTGVSGNVTGGPLVGGPSSLPLGLQWKSSGDRIARVSLVARTAAQLRAEGKLPVGITVGDLVIQAASNDTAFPSGPVQGGHPSSNNSADHKGSNSGKAQGTGTRGHSSTASSGQGGGAGGGQGGSTATSGQGGGAGGGQGGGAGGGQGGSTATSGQGGGAGGGQGGRTATSGHAGGPGAGQGGTVTTNHQGSSPAGGDQGTGASSGQGGGNGGNQGGGNGGNQGGGNGGGQGGGNGGGQGGGNGGGQGGGNGGGQGGGNGGGQGGGNGGGQGGGNGGGNGGGQGGGNGGGNGGGKGGGHKGGNSVGTGGGNFGGHMGGKVGGRGGGKGTNH